MRLTLPIIAAGIVAIVLIYSVAYKPNIRRVMEYPVVGLGNGAVSMTEPRLTGLDISDRYFVVTAKSANRVPEDPDTVTLNTVTAEISKNDEMILSLLSNRAQVHSATNVLLFDPLVQIDLPDGYSFVTDRTEVNMEMGIIKGESPIKGTGPLGEISANGFTIKRDEDIVQLKGNVHLRIDMSHMREMNQTESQSESTTE
jgi:lipopolysaccharide export system protein LptC